MIKPVSKEVMIDVKMLTNPKNFYKVQRSVDLTASRDTLNTIKGCQRPVVNNLAIDINNLKDNIAIIFQTLKNKCVINVDPSQQEIGVVREQLEDVLGNLRSKIKYSYDEVIGLVTGGRDYDITNPFADQSRDLIDEICQFLKEEQIPSTKILEQKLGRNTKGIDVRSHRDVAVLSGGVINDFARVNLQSAEQIQEAGEKAFEIFEVSPFAPVKVVDEILPDKSTNLRFL